MIDLGIARALGRTVVSLGDLVAHERISRKFLERIRGTLSGAGLVSGRPGRGGGYSLAEAPGKIVMSDLVRLLEGPLAPVACLSETAYSRCSCPDEEHCGLRLLLQDVRTAMLKVLDRSTLADVVTVTMRKLRRDGEPVPFQPAEASS